MAGRSCLSVARGGERDALGTFLTGITLSLGNPKMPLLYLALLPGVVVTSLTASQVGVLAIVMLAVEAVAIGGHVVMAVRARRYLRTLKIIRRVNRSGGSLMIDVGLAVAVSP